MIVRSVFILGRQSAIARAELESVLGADILQPMGENAVGCALPPEQINFERFGGSLRLAVPLTEINSDKWPSLQRAAAAALPHVLAALPPEGKIKLGISTFGLHVQSKQLFAAGLELKKTCKQAGRSVRLVPNNEPQLNSAQVLHNQLTGNLGVELLFIKHKNQTLLARTTAVQNITAYAERDQKRPKRDARVGMLPPKLAQIIVNLAAGKTEPAPDTVILDPFCGTGVVLQEATLMGFGVYGTDVEQRMIDYSKANLNWLQQMQAAPAVSPAQDQQNFQLEVGDATTHEWSPVPAIVACETYLGRPLIQWPRPDVLQEITNTCNTIIEKFLHNITEQIKPDTRLCVAVPCWMSPSGTFRHLPLLDRLEKIGYNRIRFEYAETQDLIYYRSDQIVTRELLVITRKR